MEKHSHLVFYDGQCGLCDQTVQQLLKVDKNEIFDFAPLQGTTAAIYLKDIPFELKNIDSFILIENYKTNDRKIYVLANGILRICWLLGGGWMLIGWLSFLPSFLFNWAYRLVARNRHRFFPQTQCFLPPPNQKDRFLS
jgi:predicted DCC family thiol-disulfide oxidoreductase YuxK